MRSFVVLAVLGVFFLASIDAVKQQKIKHVIRDKPLAAHVAAHHNEAHFEEEPLQEPAPKFIRPLNLKVLTAYDKCKMECKRQRDAEGLVAYVEQLKAELIAVETAIAEQEAAAAAEANVQNAEKPAAA